MINLTQCCKTIALNDFRALPLGIQKRHGKGIVDLRIDITAFLEMPTVVMTLDDGRQPALRLTMEFFDGALWNPTRVFTNGGHGHPLLIHEVAQFAPKMSWFDLNRILRDAGFNCPDIFSKYNVKESVSFWHKLT